MTAEPFFVVPVAVEPGSVILWRTASTPTAETRDALQRVLVEAAGGPIHLLISRPDDTLDDLRPALGDPCPVCRLTSIAGTWDFGDDTDATRPTETP